jgi:hypothetical protein
MSFFKNAQNDFQWNGRSKGFGFVEMGSDADAQYLSGRGYHLLPDGPAGR